MTKVVRLSPRKLVERYNQEALAGGFDSYLEDLKLRGFVGEDGVVYLESGATKTREEHEIWHSQHPHGDLSLEGLVDLEIRAELYAWRRAGRGRGSWRLGIPAVALLLSDFAGFTPASAAELVSDRLKLFGIMLTRGDVDRLVDRFAGYGGLGISAEKGD